MTLLNTATNLSRNSVTLPIIGTISIGAALVIFGIAYIVTRRKNKYAVVKL